MLQAGVCRGSACPALCCRGSATSGSATSPTCWRSTCCRAGRGSPRGGSCCPDCRHCAGSTRPAQSRPGRPLPAATRCRRSCTAVPSLPTPQFSDQPNTKGPPTSDTALCWTPEYGAAALGGLPKPDHDGGQPRPAVVVALAVARVLQAAAVAVSVRQNRPAQTVVHQLVVLTSQAVAGEVQPGGQLQSGAPPGQRGGQRPLAPVRHLGHSQLK